MADTTAVIEMIKRIIADDTADLRERIQHIETKITMSQPVSIGDAEEDEADLKPEKSISAALDANTAELEARLQAIKAMHRLDASPVQWTRGSGGQMVEAPEGLWEISCLACNHSTVWREGDKKPPQCKTWLIADGQKVE
jgi:hypothetical protein